MKFENGTLVKGAYVTINGVNYDVHMPEYTGKTPLSAETFNKMQEDIFPVGSVYITKTNTNPNTILGFGTWTRIKGKVLVGLDENDTDFNQVGKELGEKTHKLTINEMPKHKHDGAYKNGAGEQYDGIPPTNAVTVGGNNSAIDYTGGNQAHNNIQPTKVIGYMWTRTA